jgi:hypothetical protein
MLQEIETAFLWAFEDVGPDDAVVGFTVNEMDKEINVGDPAHTQLVFDKLEREAKIRKNGTLREGEPVYVTA